LVRNRSKGLRIENLRLRKRIKQLEALIDWASLPDEAAAPEAKTPSAPHCPSCSGPLKKIDLEQFQLDLCDNCGYRRRRAVH
jgi:hypothetical protein